MKKIIGYYHIWCTNHYEEIVREQLDAIVNSGLYDECENIFIGALGDNKEFFNLLNIIKDYPKISIATYSTNKERYEFHTLEVMKRDADKSDKDYYIFYIHGKGVQYSKKVNEVAYTGGTLWRQSMNNWIITKWRENVKELDRGYECCGVQLRPDREFAQHYSGNFFWTKSEYVKNQVPLLNKVNTGDRFEAEMYICKGKPLAATLNQDFIDYYSHQPKAVLPQGRNLVHTLCWNLYSETEQAVELLYKLNDRKDFIHVICDLEFPLQKGDEIPKDIEKAKKENTEKLKLLAKKYGSNYIKFKNEGVSTNWSTVCKHLKLQENDVILCCDSDERPQTKDWVKKCADVLRADKKLGVVSLIMPEQFNELNKENSSERVVVGNKIIDVNGETMWSQIAVSGKLINQIGGIPYPSQMSIYGGLEFSLIQQMNKHGYTWAMMKDCINVHSDQNDEVPLLRAWKNHCIFEMAHNGKKQIHLEEFLALKSEGKI